MVEKKIKLVWVPVEKADKQSIPFEILPEGGGKIIYKLPATLPFGHLELNGVDITGYFSPADDDADYICRPWMIPSAPAPAPEPDDEPDDESK